MFKMMIFDCYRRKLGVVFASVSVTYFTYIFHFFFHVILYLLTRFLTTYMQVHVSVIDDKENYTVVTFICLCSYLSMFLGIEKVI